MAKFKQFLSKVSKSSKTLTKKAGAPIEMLSGLPISELADRIPTYGEEQTARSYTPRRQKKSYLEIVLEEEIYKHGTKKTSRKKGKKVHRK